MSFSDFALTVGKIDPKICCIPYALFNLPIEYHSIAKSIADKFTWNTPTGEPCVKCPNIIQFKTLNECLSILNQTEINIFISAKELIKLIGEYITYKFDVNAYVSFHSCQDKDIAIKYMKENAVRGDIVTVNYGYLVNYIYTGTSLINCDTLKLPKEFKVLDENDEGRRPLYWDDRFQIVNFDTKPHIKDLLDNIKIDEYKQYYTEIRCCDQLLRIYANNNMDKDEDITTDFKQLLKNTNQYYTHSYNKIPETYKGCLLYVDVCYKCPNCPYDLYKNGKVYSCRSKDKDDIHNWIIENKNCIQCCSYVKDGTPCESPIKKSDYKPDPNNPNDYMDTLYEKYFNKYCDKHEKEIIEKKDEEISRQYHRRHWNDRDYDENN